MSSVIKNFIFIFLLLPACGKSPILHHEDEKEKQAQGASSSGGFPTGAASGGGGAYACTVQIPGQDLCVQLTWNRLPTTLKDGNLSVVYFRQSDGVVVDPTITVQVRSVMVCGHTPAYNPASSKVSIGNFEVDKISCPFAGDWKIKIDFLEGSGVSVLAQEYKVSVL